MQVLSYSSVAADEAASSECTGYLAIIFGSCLKLRVHPLFALLIFLSLRYDSLIPLPPPHPPQPLPFFFVCELLES